MSDYLTPVPKEVESQERFLRVLEKIPKSGIAYRGDQIIHAKDIGKEGLWRRSANYIVLVPPNEVPPKYEEIKQIRNNLQEGIRWALSYADPWYSPSYRIRESGFVDFCEYYRTHPDEVCALSWFTAPTDDYFQKVIEFGCKWYGSNSENRTGDVEKNGAIPIQNICVPIVATPDDIKFAQDKVVEAMVVGKIPEYELRYLRALEFELKHPTIMKIKKVGRLAMERELQKPFRGFDPQYKQTLVTDYLRDSGRWEFHNALSDRMMDKLFDAVDKTF